MNNILRVVLCIVAFSFVLKLTKKIIHAALLVFVLWLILHFLL